MTGEGGGGWGGGGVPGDAEDGASLCHVTSDQSGFRIKMAPGHQSVLLVR